MRLEKVKLEKLRVVKIVLTIVYVDKIFKIFSRSYRMQEINEKRRSIHSETTSGAIFDWNKKGNYTLVNSN